MRQVVSPWLEADKCALSPGDDRGTWLDCLAKSNSHTIFPTKARFRDPALASLSLVLLACVCAKGGYFFTSSVI
jgi:hypothetical protein